LNQGVLAGRKGDRARGRCPPLQSSSVRQAHKSMVTTRSKATGHWPLGRGSRQHSVVGLPPAWAPGKKRPRGGRRGGLSAVFFLPGKLGGREKGKKLLKERETLQAGRAGPHQSRGVGTATSIARVGCGKAGRKLGRWTLSLRPCRLSGPAPGAPQKTRGEVKKKNSKGEGPVSS